MVLVAVALEKPPTLLAAASPLHDCQELLECRGSHLCLIPPVAQPCCPARGPMAPLCRHHTGQGAFWGGETSPQHSPHDSPWCPVSLSSPAWQPPTSPQTLPRPDPFHRDQQKAMLWGLMGSEATERPGRVAIATTNILRPAGRRSGSHSEITPLQDQRECPVLEMTGMRGWVCEEIPGAVSLLCSCSNKLGCNFALRHSA